VPQFARTFFRTEGEGFLRGIFLACLADGHLSETEWNHLLHTTAKLGISQAELLGAIRPQARRFVEHVLADAKADGQLTDSEEATLRWLLKHLGLPADFGQYVDAEVRLLRTLTDIDRGKLQPIGTPFDVEVRAGEIVYFHSTATWRQLRMLKSGPKQDDHRGTLTFSDTRLLFASPTKSQSVSYRKIVSHRGGLDRIEVHTEGKPVDTYFLPEPSPITYALFRSLVAMANQTKLAHVEGAPSRHIPREIRQRVWLRYGGVCAECGAEQYLEFDHIIPVAKGGSNAEPNVQLLCRRCNLKKSDLI
jgi:hypothetical protein